MGPEGTSPGEDSNTPTPTKEIMRELWQSTPRGPVTTDESNILQSIERDEGEGDLSFQFFHNDQDILQPFNNNGDSDGEEKDEEHKEDLPFDESFVNPSFVDPHDIEKEKPIPPPRDQLRRQSPPDPLTGGLTTEQHQTSPELEISITAPEVLAEAPNQALTTTASGRPRRRAAPTSADMTNNMRVIDSNRAVQRDEHGNPVVPSFYFDLQERGVIQQSIELLCLRAIKVIHDFETSQNVPKNHNQARKRPNFEEYWKPAMKKQVQSLEDRGVYNLVPVTPDMMVLPGKCVFDEKENLELRTKEARAR